MLIGNLRTRKSAGFSPVVINFFRHAIHVQGSARRFAVIDIGLQSHPMKCIHETHSPLRIESTAKAIIQVCDQTIRACRCIRAFQNLSLRLRDGFVSLNPSFTIPRSFGRSDREPLCCLITDWLRNGFVGIAFFHLLLLYAIMDVGKTSEE